MAEQRAHLFKVVMLLEHLHRHAMPQVVRTQPRASGSGVTTAIGPRAAISHGTIDGITRS